MRGVYAKKSFHDRTGLMFFFSLSPRPENERRLVRKIACANLYFMAGNEISAGHITLLMTECRVLNKAARRNIIKSNASSPVQQLCNSVNQFQWSYKIEVFTFTLL